MLRWELSVRGRELARRRNLLHELSPGGNPVVMFGQNDAGRHGNFLAAAYERICANEEWARRQGYQLIRNVLAAFAGEAAFCVLCDGRRRDLIEVWYFVLAAGPGDGISVEAEAADVARAGGSDAERAAGVSGDEMWDFGG